MIVEPDKQTLAVHYELSGKAHVERISFAQPIVDFRYCPWVHNTGVAVVARTGNGEKAEYFYSAFYLFGASPEHQPLKIKAPAGEYPVLGIGNTGGDSVVITALQHTRNRENSKEQVSGWMWIDNCPCTDLGVEVGYLTPLSAVANPEAKK